MSNSYQKPRWLEEITPENIKAYFENKDQKVSTMLDIYDKYDYPWPNTILISASFYDFKDRFDEMLHQKQETLKNRILNAKYSHFSAEVENYELQMCWDMLEMAETIYWNTVKELEEQHFYDFMKSGKPKLFTIKSPDGEIKSSALIRYDRVKVKSLQVDINKLKAELNIS